MNKPFIEHVHELRRRLGVSAIACIGGAALAYWQHQAVLGWLQAPLHGKLYYSQVMGAFDFLMQACLLVGLLFAIPVLVYNLVCFVRPALPKPVSGRQVFWMVAASSGLAAGGVAFAYYATLPLVLRFLSSVDVSQLHPLIAASSYLSFVTAYLSVFAIVFQLPLILLLIDRITPIPPAGLSRWRKWVIIGAFTAALILPIAPDPVSQVMLALPVVVLYEISLWLVVAAHRGRRSRVERAQRALAAAEAAQAAAAVPQVQAQAPVRMSEMRPVVGLDVVRGRGAARVIDLRSETA